MSSSYELPTATYELASASATPAELPDRVNAYADPAADPASTGSAGKGLPDKKATAVRPTKPASPYVFNDAQIGYSNTFRPVEYFLALAFWYLVLTGIWSVIQAWIERKLAASERGDELSFWERLVEAWTPVHAWARGAR